MGKHLSIAGVRVNYDAKSRKTAAEMKQIILAELVASEDTIKSVKEDIRKIAEKITDPERRRKFLAYLETADSSVSEEYMIEILSDDAIKKHVVDNQPLMSPRVKLEYLQQASPRFSELNDFILERLIAAANLRFIRKSRVTRGCEEAAEAISAAPFEELKSIIHHVKVGGESHYIVFHLRGDEELDMEQVEKKVREKFGDQAVLVEEVDEHGRKKAFDVETLGLAMGRVNPWSCEFLKTKGYKIEQVFSATILEKVSINLGNKLYTNLGSNFWRFGFNAADIRSIFPECEFHEIASPLSDRAQEFRKLYSLYHEVTCIGDNQSAFRADIQIYCSPLILKIS